MSEARPEILLFANRIQKRLRFLCGFHHFKAAHYTYGTGPVTRYVHQDVTMSSATFSLVDSQHRNYEKFPELIFNKHVVISKKFSVRDGLTTGEEYVDEKIPFGSVRFEIALSMTIAQYR